MPFPAVIPSSRTYLPGRYPVKTYTAMSGVKVRRLFGNQPTERKLSLGYANISDVIATQFLDYYHNRLGETKPFLLPFATFAGMSDILAIAVRQFSDPAIVVWRFEEEPEIESVFPGRSSVSVKLIGEPAWNDVDLDTTIALSPSSQEQITVTQAEYQALLSQLATLNSQISTAQGNASGLGASVAANAAIIASIQSQLTAIDGELDNHPHPANGPITQVSGGTY